MLIPVRATIPRKGKNLGAPRFEYADVPAGEIVRAAALTLVDGCTDLQLRIQLREAFDAAEKDGRFDLVQEV